MKFPDREKVTQNQNQLSTAVLLVSPGRRRRACAVRIPGFSLFAEGKKGACVNTQMKKKSRSSRLVVPIPQPVTLEALQALCLAQAALGLSEARSMAGLGILPPAKAGGAAAPEGRLGCCCCCCCMGWERSAMR